MEMAITRTRMTRKGFRGIDRLLSLKFMILLLLLAVCFNQVPYRLH